MLAAGEFLESAEVYGNRYGTSRNVVRDLLGADWTAEMDAAWDETLKGLDDYVNKAIAAMRPAA